MSRSIATIFSLLVFTFSTAEATEQATSTNSDSTLIESSKPIFFIGQKFWAATWDMPLIDAEVVFPGPSLKTNNHPSMSKMEIIPVTTLGIQYKNVSLSTNLFSKTNFTSIDDQSSTINRSEWDVSLSYSVLPNLITSIAYKSGTVDRLVTNNAQALFGTSLGYKVDGWLIGLSGSAPLQGPLSLYGSMAYGIARSKIDGDTLFDGNYKIGEIGLSYRLIEASSNVRFFKSLTAQLGYRAQIITLQGITYNTYSIPPGPSPISTRKLDTKSTTDGLVFGIVAAF